jgi:hypothetical protein
MCPCLNVIMIKVINYIFRTQKMSWITASNALFRHPVRTPFKDSTIHKEITTFLLCSLNDGVVWNPEGKKHPCKHYGTGWVWASADSKVMITYINSLWNNNIVPILYSENKFDNYVEIIDEILSMLDYDPLIFLDTTPEQIKELLIDLSTDSNSPVKNKESSKFIIKLDEFPPIVKCQVYTIPKCEKSEIVGYDLLDINVDSRMALKEFKGLIILMGQQGSGKSTVAFEYRRIGYNVVTEVEALSLFRGIGVDRFIDDLKSIKESKIKGVVIDATNPSKVYRDFYARLAKGAGVESTIGWLTRPGWRWNNKRQIPITQVALTIYTHKFEAPTHEAYVRLI